MINLSAGLRIYRLNLLQRGETPLLPHPTTAKKKKKKKKKKKAVGGIPSIKLDYIWWWGSSSGDLRGMEYPSLLLLPSPL